MSETKKKTATKKPALKKAIAATNKATTTIKEMSGKFKNLAEILADVELPKGKRFWVEVSPEWVEAAKEVQKIK